MTLSAALHAAVAVLRRRPADLLPFYVLGAATPAIARVIPFIGVAIAVVYLQATGRLEAARATLTEGDLSPPDAGAQPEAFAEWVDGLAPIGEVLLPPVVVAVLVLGVVLALLVYLVLAAGIAAGQIAACDARLGGERGLTAGIVGVRRYWRSFLGAYVLEGAVWLVVTAGSLVVVAVTAAASPLALLLVAPITLLAWFATVTITRALFAFVPVAIVVDGVGVLSSLSRSAAFLRRNPIGAVGYFVVAIGTVLAFGSAVAVLSVLRTEAVAAPVAYLLVWPALDLVKTGLYDEYRGTLSPPSEPTPGVRAQLSSGIRCGLREVGAFVRGAPGSHVLAVVVVAVGAATGWAGAEPLVGSLETSIEARLADHVPPFAALAFFGNNWTVVSSMAFAGIALVAPALFTLWFNGLVLGVYARLEVDPSALVAFVVPHGVVEIPSLVVAGALGTSLGVATWRTWRGYTGRAALADAMERAFWVVVGLGVLLAVAALVEGFVSPYYWRPFL